VARRNDHPSYYDSTCMASGHLCRLASGMPSSSSRTTPGHARLRSRTLQCAETVGFQVLPLRHCSLCPARCVTPVGPCKCRQASRSRDRRLHGGQSAAPRVGLPLPA